MRVVVRTALLSLPPRIPVPRSVGTRIARDATGAGGTVQSAGRSVRRPLGYSNKPAKAEVRGPVFDRYTEKARRVIFFARYEASQFGSPHIETEHMLLGLLRESKPFLHQFQISAETVEQIRKKIEVHTPIRQPVSTSMDLPLSNECKRVLAYAAEEAERLRNHHIGTEHLLLGLLREKNTLAAALLGEQGIELGEARKRISASWRTDEVPGVGSTLPQEGALGEMLEYVDSATSQSLGEFAVPMAVPRRGELVILSSGTYRVVDVVHDYVSMAEEGQLYGPVCVRIYLQPSQESGRLAPSSSPRP